eukprot:156192-Chlamydomonas_euryale.AAC.1
MAAWSMGAGVGEGVCARLAAPAHEPAPTVQRLRLATWAARSAVLFAEPSSGADGGAGADATAAATGRERTAPSRRRPRRGEPYYAIARGSRMGIFRDWAAEVQPL